MKFLDYTIDQFNKEHGIEATEEMTMEELTDYIESKGIDYEYASDSKEDALEAYKNFLDEQEGMNPLKECDLIKLNNIYLVLY